MVEDAIDLSDACIKVDAIMSYPWSAENKLCIFPHHQILALEQTEICHQLLDLKKK